MFVLRLYHLAMHFNLSKFSCASAQRRYLNRKKDFERTVNCGFYKNLIQSKNQSSVGEI